MTRTTRQIEASADPTFRPGPHVLIIGGGASGVLMATHLLSLPTRNFRVTVVEGAHMLGCGIAYSTRDPQHLLNTRVKNMSAFPDQPEHFLRWLRKQPGYRRIDGDSFVRRGIYGAYLAALLEPWSTADEPRRLRCVQQNCTEISETARGVVARLSDGQTLIGDTAIIATGHVVPKPDPKGLVHGAWEDPGVIAPSGRVIIVGTGLSMVDQVLSLLKAGHRGEILALSRRGQLPRTHTVTKPVALTLADIPRFAPMSVVLRWARTLADEATEQGGTWRDAVDGLRPFVRSIWRALPPVERARFLRHAATWWDVHRHRIPPDSAKVIEAAQARGQLVVRRAAWLGARAEGVRKIAQFRPVHSEQIVETEASSIIDCRGIRRDPGDNATPLFAGLLARGQARVDPMRLGLDVSIDCRLIDCTGTASDRVHVIGPASRAAFWEVTAIPDIREQTHALAARLLAGHISIVERQRRPG